MFNTYVGSESKMVSLNRSVKKKKIVNYSRFFSYSNGKGEKILTRRVIIVNSNRQISRHVGDWVPPFHGKVDASFFLIQVIEVEQNLFICKTSSLEVPHLSGQNISVQVLLLNDVTSWNSNVQHCHTRSTRFIDVSPSANKFNKSINLIIV